MTPSFLSGPPSDSAAIRRSLSEPRAFAIVFDRHFGVVHGYAQRRVGPDLADDIAAETFARAFDGRSKFDLCQADARPWLLGIATNLMRRHWRGERRRLEAYGRAVQPPAGGGAPSLGAELAGALDGLAQRDREALLLLALADLSYGEIAVAIGIPIGTVRSRIARARRILRGRVRVAAPELSRRQPVRESSRA